MPTTQSVVNAFAITDDNSNRFQDVGMDGLSDQQPDIEGRTEQAFFSDYLDNLDPGARAVWQSDPRRTTTTSSGQRLRRLEPDILERYKLFNGLEGNSITDEDSPEDYPTQANTLPTTEDINQDQNLGERSYFSTKMDLKPQDMVVGQNFITDRILATANTPEGPKQVYWYQFKVPVRLPDKVVNGIQDFRSIRFMRMYLKDWQQPVVLRFARLEFVRGEWRKYNFSLETPGEVIGGDPDATTYETAAVNIEENGNRTPINYVLPPGINQEIDVASANLRNLNEQSLQLLTCNLRDGDARASFRNVNFDIRSYKKMRMFIHAEGPTPTTRSSTVTSACSCAWATTWTRTITSTRCPWCPAPLNNNDPYNVWPETNNTIIEFAKLNDVKISRDQSGIPRNERVHAVRWRPADLREGQPEPGPDVHHHDRHPEPQAGRARGQSAWSTDDGQPQCAEVWVNELRLTDFDQRGGWAAIAQVNTTPGRPGHPEHRGNYSTPFWGSIDKRVSERQRETKYRVDISSNLELGSSCRRRAACASPCTGLLGGGQQSAVRPAEPGHRMGRCDADAHPEERKERLKRSQTYTRRRSINFTNVRKERTGAGPERNLWDVENFAVSYAYSDREFHDINTAYENERSYRGLHHLQPRAQAQAGEALREHRLHQQQQLVEADQGVQLLPGPEAVEPAHLGGPHLPGAVDPAEPGHRDPAPAAHLQQDLQLEQPVRLPVRDHQEPEARLQRQQQRAIGGDARHREPQVPRHLRGLEGQRAHQHPQLGRGHGIQPHDQPDLPAAAGQVPAHRLDAANTTYTAGYQWTVRPSSRTRWCHHPELPEHRP